MYRPALMMLLSQIITGYRPSSADPSSTLKSVTDQYFQWRLKNSPETATYLNVHKYDDLLSQYGLGQMDFTKAKVDGFLKDLGQINYQSLSRKEQSNYAVLNDTLTTVSDAYQWRLYGGLNPINFLEGNQVTAGMAAYITPFQTKTNFENYIARLRGFPQEIQDEITLMKEAIRLKRTNSIVSMLKVPSQLEAIVKDDPSQSVVYTPFRGFLDRLPISQQEKEELRTRGLNASSETNEAFRDLKLFIQQEYMNHTRATYGVHGLDQGKKYYAQCLKWHTTSDIPPQQLHDIGLKEIARISNEMKQIMQRQNFSGSIPEYFKMLKNDPDFHFKTQDEIIARYKDIINNRIFPKLPRLFKHIPPKVRVIKMDNDGGVASYRHGSSDGKQPGVFRANVHRPNETDTYNMMAVALHEAVPGHHLQRTLQMASDLPNFRKEDIKSRTYSVPYAYPGYTAYIEGWGLYSEFLGVEMGLYKDDYELMGRYNNEIWRACRLVVDTGIHYLGWNRSRAVDYFHQHTALSGVILQNEIDRYITWPGQSCAYKVGEMKIKELRRKAETVLGSLFDIKEFHEIVLTAGPVPLFLLESAVNDWISATQRLSVQKS